MTSRIGQRIAVFATATLVATGLSVITAGPAAASGCSAPPCGRVENKTGTYIRVRWKNDNSDPWSYASLAPGQGMGGYWHRPKRDIDGFYAPKNCRTAYSVRAGSEYHVYGGWVKVSSNETAKVLSVTCPG
ncbi:hypothetical protein HS041_04815 [Planomonospora sp. ID67723]|uniref:hypothetical protein n=1 Tax=Planomonospora sp. ID67723 TaxID=2738134 RepID=UPI0018C449A8|nr:hypothetical protein [Planomonospora sp. ID67723]MBG0827082.1 hypothetical protein [Planomonospora sp. ID67723]